MSSGWKLHSLHAPEVECIGKGKAHRPHGFGVKVSIATTNARSPGGQFVVHAKALPGNPYGGLTPEAARIRSAGDRLRNPDQLRRSPATIVAAEAV